MIYSNRFISIRLVLAASVIASGCASFEPGLRLQDLQKPRQPTARAVQEGVEVSVEEFFNPAKSQMMFDTDLVDYGVAALLMRVENNAGEKYSALRDNVRASVNGQPLTPLTPKEAADKAATSEYAGKALGWTLATGPFAMVLWPLTIGASAVHTHGVNKRIEAYFDAGGFQDALLSPKQNTLGFVYFKLPDGVKKPENFIVETDVIEDGTGKKLNYKFDVTTPQAVR
jgi:hypothetical protein